MRKRRIGLTASAVGAAIGYAANTGGRGVAYARITGAEGEHLLRVPFRVDPGTTFADREIGYAALTAIVYALHERGLGRVRFALSDADLIEDVTAHRDVPPSVVIPYVRLRCALNQLVAFTLEFATESDLAQRARAEVELNVAA
jgi:hypothetical protein